MSNTMPDGRMYPTGPLVAVSLPQLLLSDNRFVLLCQQYEEFYIEHVSVSAKFTTVAQDGTDATLPPIMYSKIDSNGPFNVISSQFQQANTAKYTQTGTTYYMAPFSIFADVTSAPPDLVLQATPNGNPYTNNLTACAVPMNPIKSGASILHVLCPGYNDQSTMAAYRYSMRSWIDPEAMQFKPIDLRLGSSVYMRSRHTINYPSPSASWAQLTHNKFISQVDTSTVPVYNGSPSYIIVDKVNSIDYSIYEYSRPFATRYITLKNFAELAASQRGLITDQPNPWVYFCLKPPVHFDVSGQEVRPVQNARYRVSVTLRVYYTVQFRGMSQV